MENLFDHRYQKLDGQPLGVGTFGEVWKVLDTETNKVEALKIYTSSSKMDGNSIFTHEFALLSDVNHPNLLNPRHFAISQPEGYPYLVLKYCSQGNITNLIGRFDELRAWNLLRDMASALACLHSMYPPVIHQDIKPANILMDGDKFMLSDFGVSTQARAISSPTGGIDDTLQSVGTIAYWAPEKFSQDSKPIMANDIWSLGATIFEMLSGELPFGNDGGLMQRPDTRLPELGGFFSDKLKNVIASCLAYKTKDRPFASDLEKIARETIEEYENNNNSGTVMQSFQDTTLNPLEGGSSVSTAEDIPETATRFSQRQEIVGPSPDTSTEYSKLNIILLSVAAAAGLIIGAVMTFLL